MLLYEFVFYLFKFNVNCVSVNFYLFCVDFNLKENSEEGFNFLRGFLNLFL